jgi:hypothetical protein
MKKTVKNFFLYIHFQNEGLSPLCIALPFDGFGSISLHNIWVFFGFDTIFNFFFFLDFQLF